LPGPPSTAPGDSKRLERIDCAARNSERCRGNGDTEHCPERKGIERTWCRWRWSNNFNRMTFGHEQTGNAVVVTTRAAQARNMPSIDDFRGAGRKDHEPL